MGVRSPTTTVRLVLRLFDTAEGAVVPFEPAAAGQVSMYVCGPTVDGPAHLGHGRFALVFDVLRRYLEWCGLEVTYVSNITDIDDKIIERAAQAGQDPADLAARYEREWWEDMDAVGVKRPTHSPHATEYVEQMVDLIGHLVERGVAYETSDGVYFQADRVDDYGLLARQSVESLKAGARVEASAEKRSPVDFALWKKAKPGEPSWPAPWGAGRPGWHTECVVMSLDLLGEGFDLHGGGHDLAFPHHENERAQAVALGKDFARCWVHNGFVEVDGEKMSKSLGNFTTLGELVRTVDRRAYRLLVLRAHYRSPQEVTKKSIADAAAALDRLDAFARRAGSLSRGEADAPTVARFRELMDDDLNTPGALAVLFEAVRTANRALDLEDEVAAAPLAAAVVQLAGALGLVLGTDAVGEIPADVTALLARRDEARAAKDWEGSDQLRDRLADMGWVVEDGAQGSTVRRA